METRSAGGGGGSRDNSGRALPVLYAKHLKYTKRERELTLTQIDIDAIHNFASFPDLVNRLVSMFAPDVYGNEEVKLGLLLAAVRGAPIQNDNWYRRHWINVGMLGDKGTGKTTLMYHALKLVLGSQSVSGQHSTGKGIVAVADRVGTGGEPMLRAGAAVLANHALLGIDEIGTMPYEDQDQFLSLMDKGYFDFNKMGIRQRLVSEAGFIINSNTINGRWREPNSVSVDEIPLKGQLIDRLDLVFIFRKPVGESETNAYADNMYQLSKKHFNLDFMFLRKYIYYILNNPQFDSIAFEDSADTLRLRDFWKNLMKDNPEFAGNRSFESIFKIAKAFARLTLKTIVDLQTVDQTIDFISKVFAKHGTQVIQPVDYLSMTYLEMCNIVKKHSIEKSWAEHNSPDAVQLADITFNQAAEIAAKNNRRIADYLGTNYGSSVNKAARRLREKFRDSQDKDFDNGKIKVTAPFGQFQSCGF